MSHTIEFISAGAGSGKTYRMTSCLYEELTAGVNSEKVIATTFTKKAANELVERVRQRLMAENEYSLAIGVGESLIGTVNSICGKLLGHLAFAAGLPPQLDVIDEQPAAQLFAQALEDALDADEVRIINRLATRLGQEDWKKTIHILVNQARSNTISATSLPEQAERSLTELLAFFPPPPKQEPAREPKRELDHELQAAIEAAVAEINSNGDLTKGTATYLGTLREALHHLKRAQLPWSSWVKLSKAKATKRSEPVAEQVREIAMCYDRHPGLRNDVSDWICRIYAIAMRVMDSYQNFKKERGLIDFIDQEELLLRLLDDPKVLELLEGEIDLLLVDEFQDTSPIQLALFVRLATLAKKSVWVGDVKQAIYGFRGCDPALMNAVIEVMKNNGKPVESLDTSRRSRPQLVHLVNALFVPAFEEQLPAAQVQLKPHRTEEINDSALEFWTLEGSNKELRGAALATGVLELFSAEQQVVDRDTQQVRPLRFRDVALLCRTNDNAAACAAVLAGVGLPVNLGRPGLLATPEVRLALACLRRMVDANDTLASAEIVSLSAAELAEEWLQERIDFLEQGGISRKWRLEGDNLHPALVGLEQLRPELPVLSPSEVLERVLLLGEVERAAVSWGPTPFAASQRLTNLETLRANARTYEDSCRRTRSAATIAGLLFWLDDLAEEELDNRQQDDNADAIQVLTHHRAKGLEWPVVICADLDFNIRPRIWGCSAQSETAQIDITQPLAGRYIRYWPWPFAKQSAGIALSDALTQSPLGIEDFATQTWEAKRLLYVSMTRARDRLILLLNLSSRQNPWLDCLQADWLQPCEGELSMPTGQTILCSESVFAPDESDSARTEVSALPWFPVRREPTPKLSANIIPSAMSEVSATIGRTLRIGTRLTLRGDPQMDTIGTAIHGILGAYLGGGLAVNATERALTLLEHNHVASHVEAGEILARAEALKANLISSFGATSFHPEWPVQGITEEGQRFTGWVDLLVDTPHGWILIDHKTYPGKETEWAEQALKYSGQLQLYSRTVAAATGKPVLSQWIHFCIGGSMVEVIG
ncbi:MAG: UvrD-helicase domain-containing protein [Desulfuromonas sp.]|nr:UvrD-helicase domain-containing protein [Desulfuromonas sp.]